MGRAVDAALGVDYLTAAGCGVVVVANVVVVVAAVDVVVAVVVMDGIEAYDDDHAVHLAHHPHFRCHLIQCHLDWVHLCLVFLLLHHRLHCHLHLLHRYAYCHPVHLRRRRCYLLDGGRDWADSWIDATCLKLGLGLYF